MNGLLCCVYEQSCKYGLKWPNQHSAFFALLTFSSPACAPNTFPLLYQYRICPFLNQHQKLGRCTFGEEPSAGLILFLAWNLTLVGSWDSGSYFPAPALTRESGKV